MKKYILFVVAAAAMVACNKSEVPSIDGGKNEADQKYVIYAEDVNTRTVTDASFTVTWTNNDNLAVYTWPVGVDLPADAASWRAVNPVNFVASDVSASPKPFSLSEADDANSQAVTNSIEYASRLSAFKARNNGTSNLQWGVIYPGRFSYGSNPGLGIVSFGNRPGVRVTQDGNDNMSHLAVQDVLCGTATGANPTVEMHHLGTMMVYTVKNATSSEFIVKSIKISVPAASIGGDFRVEVFKGTIASCMTALNECTLYVSNGAAIAAGSSANFYQVLAPFGLESGKQITMTVETDKGIWTKTTTLSAAKSFESGKRNTATLNIDTVKEADPTLKLHETGIIKFGEGSKLSRYLNLNTAELMIWTNGFNRYSEVDAIVARNGASTAFAIAAPTYEYATAFDGSIANWTTKNSTKFKNVTVNFDTETKNFDTVTKLSELKKAYDDAADEQDRIDLAVGDVIIAKTVKGNYALIKMTSGTKTDAGKWTDWSFSLKTVL